MYSIAFPEMVNGARTYTFKDHRATESNLKLILKTMTRNVLFGDPNYGTDLLTVIFQQNNSVLWDLIQDQIYSAIKIYIPQLELERNDIEVYGEGSKLFAKISAINKIDNTLDLYNIELTNLEEK